MYHSGYLRDVFGDPRRYSDLVYKVCHHIDDIKIKLGFDAIAFRGLSGSAMAFPVSARLGIPLIHIRKSEEDCHGLSVESWAGTIYKYVILDDLIDSGKTVESILCELNEQELECVGICLWNWCVSCPENFFHSKIGKSIEIFKVFE